MNDSNAQNFSGQTEVQRKMGFTEKLGIKDDDAGEKIKDLADKTGFIGTLGCLVLGFLIWNSVSGLTGFLLGFLITGAGVLASFLLVSFLYSYGDMVTNSIEQMKILKRLEEKKKAEELRLEPTAQKEFTATVVTTAQAEQTKAQPPKEDTPDEDPEDEDDKVIDPKISEKLRKLARIPLRGAVDARMRRVAHFAERSPYGIICPVCSRKQESERDNCYFCDCRFVYDDEPFTNNDDMLDRLHRIMENKPG